MNLPRSPVRSDLRDSDSPPVPALNVRRRGYRRTSRIRSQWRKFATPLIALLLSGCAVYQQPTLPVGQSASLAFEQILDTKPITSVALTKIDGKVPSNISSVLRHRSPIRVAPGKHIIDVSFVVGVRGSGRASLWFVAEPGGDYIVRGVYKKKRKFTVWVEETNTGKHVGGIMRKRIWSSDSSGASDREAMPGLERDAATAYSTG